MSQMKGQDKTPEKQLNGDRQLPGKELRIMIVKMVRNLWKKREDAE